MALAELSINEKTTDKDWKAISDEFETAPPESRASFGHRGIFPGCRARYRFRR